MKDKIRINKFLSLCGLGSRRQVESFILNRQVRVNGTFIETFSALVDVEHDVVLLNNNRVLPITDEYYLILNKPRGYITTMKEMKNRLIVMDLIPERFKQAGVFPVGRLDKDSEGLLLMTNNGDLAFRLTHPRFGVTKRYIVELNKPLDDRARAKVEKGIYMYGARTKPASIEIIDREHNIIAITLKEGKKRQIRVSFFHVGYRVKKLKRVEYGPLDLHGIKSGGYRLLKARELAAIKAAVGLA